MQSNKGRLIIFDLDGTLVDAYQAVCLALNAVLKEMGYPPAQDLTIKRNVGWGEQSLLEAFVDREDIPGAQALYRQEHKRALPLGTQFLPKAQELLITLKQKGYRLGVATNRPAWSTRIIMEHLKMDGFFDHVLSADQVANAKPQPDILYAMLAHFSLKPEEVVYVGDMTVDVETGNRAGIRTIAVLTGSSTRAEVEALNPFRTVADLSPVADILDEFEPVLSDF